jgi:hypothetical protein
MPRPGKPHEKLNALIGTWIGEETIHPSPWDPQGGKTEARIVNRSALGGFVVEQDYEQRRDGQLSFEGRGIFGYDAGEQDYQLFWFDSMGLPPNHYRGTFEGTTLVLGTRSPRGHSRVTFELTSRSTYEFRMEVSVDGHSWKTFIEGRYRRKS